MITVADSDDRVAERRIVERFGEIEVLSRTPLDDRVLNLLKLKHGDWIEWSRLARRS